MSFRFCAAFALQLATACNVYCRAKRLRNEAAREDSITETHDGAAERR
jgi:hypothetical protein